MSNPSDQAPSADAAQTPPSIPSLWIDTQPLVLASASAARKALLASAGIRFLSHAADIDERAIEAPLKARGAASPAIASALARAKALAVSSAYQGQLVLGADQTLSLGPEHFSKPADRDAARRQLEALSGQTHYLHSALAVVSGGEIIFETLATAALTMRPLGEQFLELYLDAAGDAVVASVGAYQIEALGIHLFERIDGDHSTIMGLPLLPLLQFLRLRGALAG